MKDLRDTRSLLFVPGNRPERFAKAASSGADGVCIDLEDAVAPRDRAAARTRVLAFLQDQPAGHAFGLRVSALGTADGQFDLAALRESNAKPAFVMLAKCESAQQLQSLAEAAAGVPLIALLESACAILAATSLAQATSKSMP